MALREGEPAGMEKLFESSLDTIIQGALDKNAYLELSEQNVLRDCIELNNVSREGFLSQYCHYFDFFVIRAL